MSENITMQYPFEIYLYTVTTKVWMHIENLKENT